MRITLILAASPTDPLRRNDPFMPLSLPILAGSAPGHEYTFVDMLAGEEPDLSRRADLVGISVRLTAETTAFRIADEHRKRGIPVVLGGPQVSSVPHRAAEHADSVVVGEGEVLWPTVIEDLRRRQLRKFYVASPEPFDGRGQSVHQVESYADLAKTPFPVRRHYRKKYVFDTVFAARGCPIDCDFCSVPHLFGHEVRLRPVGDVVREIDAFDGFFYLLDDTVFGRPSTYDYYLELYAAIARLPKQRLWTGQANLDAATTEKGREVVRAAARAGLLYAAIGMESLNPEVQQRSGTLRKSGGRTPSDLVERMRQSIAFIQGQGILVSGWFTMGYEEDRLEDFASTLEFCRDNHVIPILCPLEALPGTRLRTRLEAEGRVSPTRKINVVHPTLTDDQILGALKEASDAGFGVREILSRTLFAARTFGRQGGELRHRIPDVIKKTMFTLNLQVHLRRGIVGLANAE